ncbi:MAG: putative Ig domain-containing protein, partial [Sphingobacteriaceae bacterium]|nr:putative Ig domain-containing protein [Sphingobacteriaceae bacterium]
MKKLFAIISLAVVMLNAKAQTITSFSPASGSVGTLVTFIGTDLSNPTAVNIGGQSAIVISSSATQVVAMVMPGATSGALSISTSGGTANVSDSFTVVSSKVPNTQQGNKLVGNNAVGNATQGRAVALSADGTTAIVGGTADDSNKGAAWIYVRTGSTWTQQDKLVGSDATVNAQQGFSVSISADGNTAIVGGFGDDGTKGAAWIWVRTAGTWAQQGLKLVGNDAFGNAGQGRSVSISADGNTAIVGGNRDASNKGAAWIWVRTGTNWTQQGNKLVGGATGAANQGGAVALSADGNTAIVGGETDDTNKGAAWIWVRTGTNWAQQGKLVGDNIAVTSRQGTSVSLSADGNTAIVGGSIDNSNKGAAWVYVRTGTNWTQQGSKLVANDAVGNAGQGRSVFLSADGNTAMVGGSGDATNKGAAWIWVRTGTDWAQQGAKLVGTGAVGNAAQGISVSISADGTTAMVGGFVDDSNKGAVWVYAPALLPTIQYSVKKLNIAKDVAMAALNPIVSNAVGATYGITPLLPNGLSIDGNTGVISGTPSVVNNATSYTVTITNSDGQTASTVLSIAIGEVPNISVTPKNYVFGANFAITPIDIINTGGAIPPQLRGFVSTFVGNGNAGSADGDATTAEFNEPRAVVL